MPSHTDEERAKNRAAKAADAARNKAANAARNRTNPVPKPKPKPKRSTQSPFMRGLRGMFGMGVEGTSRALERSEGIFDRTAKELEERQKRRR